MMDLKTWDKAKSRTTLFTPEACYFADFLPVLLEPLQQTMHPRVRRSLLAVDGIKSVKCCAVRQVSPASENVHVCGSSNWQLPFLKSLLDEQSL